MSHHDVDASPLSDLSVTLTELGGAPRPAMDRAHELGLRWVQLSATQAGLRPRELDASARRDLLATLRRRELGLSGLDVWLPPDHFLDPATVDRALGAATGAVGLAADLGRVPVSINLPRVGEEAPQVAALSEVIDALTTIADRQGVAIADHTLPAQERSGIGMGIDPAACLAIDTDPVSLVTAAGGNLISARLCDLLRTGMRGPIGSFTEGRLDVAAYRATLSVVGYDRPVIVDARQWSSPLPGITTTIRAWESAGI